MFADNDYVRVGRLDDLQKAGYLKVRLMGRQIMIVFGDSHLRLTTYPVKIDGNDIFIGANPLN